MNNRSGILVLILLGLFIGIYSSAYTIDETEQVIITQFGRPVGDAIIEPRVNFKIP